MLVLRQRSIHDAIQPARLVLVPRHAVGDLLWCVAREVIRLALHGAKAAHLPKELDQSLFFVRDDAVTETMMKIPKRRRKG